jgi:hypothetical protein
MRKKFYLPRSLNKRAQWLNNFARAFEIVAPSLNFTIQEVQSVKDDTAIINWVAKVQVMMKGTHKSFTAFKDLMNGGTARHEQLNIPQLPLLPPTPKPVAPGIFKRITKLAQRIKFTKGYTKSIGKKLGIVGSEQKIDISKAKPQLTVKMVAGKLEVHWKKSVFTGIELYINQNNGKGFAIADKYTHSPAKLKIKLPRNQSTALWQVMAFYVLGNDAVGEASHIVEVVVRNPVT